MKSFVFGALLCSLAAFAQDVTQELGSFHKITVFDRIDAHLVASSENKIIIKGINADEVQVVNKKGELKIRMPLDKLLQGDHISVTIYCSGINAVEANEGARIDSEATFDPGAFDIIAKEGGEVKLQLDVDKLNVRLSQGARVELGGKARVQDVLVNSGAEYEADELITEQTSITSNAGGNADVHATSVAQAKVRAGGTITVYGNPANVSKKTFAGGTITVMP